MKISKRELSKLARSGKATSEDGKPISMDEFRRSVPLDKNAELKAILKALSALSGNSEAAAKVIAKALSELKTAISGDGKKTKKLKIVKIVRDSKGLMQTAEIEVEA